MLLTGSDPARPERVPHEQTHPRAGAAPSRFSQTSGSPASRATPCGGPRRSKLPLPRSLAGSIGGRLGRRVRRVPFGGCVLPITASPLEAYATGGWIFPRSIYSSTGHDKRDIARILRVLALNARAALRPSAHPNQSHSSAWPTLDADNAVGVFAHWICRRRQPRGIAVAAGASQQLRTLEAR